MPKITAVHNWMGKLKRVLLGKPYYVEVCPPSDATRDLHDSGITRDHSIGLKQ